MKASIQTLTKHTINRDCVGPGELDLNQDEIFPYIIRESPTMW